MTKRTSHKNTLTNMSAIFNLRGGGMRINAAKDYWVADFNIVRSDEIRTALRSAQPRCTGLDFLFYLGCYDLWVKYKIICQ